MMKKIIRQYKTEDCREIIQLFYNTVHTINRKDYNPAQLDAWASKDSNIEKWDKSLSNNYTILVESDGIITGFGDLNDTGYFDHLFVHKDFQKKGIATLIAEEIEKYAKESNITIITTEASITAKPFFEKRGYQVLQQQAVEREGQMLINFLMKKQL
jgi:putative acetyltransferase